MESQRIKVITIHPLETFNSICKFNNNHLLVVEIFQSGLKWAEISIHRAMSLAWLKIKVLAHTQSWDGVLVLVPVGWIQVSSVSTCTRCRCYRGSLVLLIGSASSSGLSVVKMSEVEWICCWLMDVHLLALTPLLCHCGVDVVWLLSGVYHILSIYGFMSFFKSITL